MIGEKRQGKIYEDLFVSKAVELSEKHMRFKKHGGK